jgi:cAMP phosphodiesterase
MKKFFLIFILFLIVAVGAYIGISSITYSKGTRVGSLMKFSEKGFVFKTFEGTVNLEFINTSGGKLVSNTWDFSARGANKNLLDSLTQHDDRRMRFYYEEKLNALPWLGETEYFVYKVDIIEDKGRDGMRNF